MQDEKIKKEEPSGIGFVNIIEQNNWYVVAFPPSPWCPLGIHDTGGYYFHLKFSLLPLKRYVRPVPAILALVRRSDTPRPFCRQVPGDISLNPFRSPPYRLAGRPSEKICGQARWKNLRTGKSGINSGRNTRAVTFLKSGGYNVRLCHSGGPPPETSRE